MNRTTGTPIPAEVANGSPEAYRRWVAEQEALRRYPPQDGDYPGVDRNAQARAAYLAGRADKEKSR